MYYAYISTPIAPQVPLAAPLKASFADPVLVFVVVFLIVPYVVVELLTLF